MRFVMLLLIPLFIAACDGVNPSMTNDIAGAKPPVVVQKPTACNMDFSQTCWRKTIAQMTACLAPSTVKDMFSADREFCSNAATEKLVHFENPGELFGHPLSVLQMPMAFRVYPNAISECLSFSGTATNFEITLKASGERVQFAFDEDTMQFSCLDGQTVTIATDKINGCEQSLGNAFKREVPGIDFTPIYENGIAKGHRFRFAGAPDTPDIFKCYNP